MLTVVCLGNHTAITPSYRLLLMPLVREIKSASEIKTKRLAIHCNQSCTKKYHTPLHLYSKRGGIKMTYAYKIAPFMVLLHLQLSARIICRQCLVHVRRAFVIIRASFLPIYLSNVRHFM